MKFSLPMKYISTLFILAAKLILIEVLNQQVITPPSSVKLHLSLVITTTIHKTWLLFTSQSCFDFLAFTVMSAFQIIDEPLPGVYVIEAFRFHDVRGSFTKLVHTEFLSDQGIVFTPAESFLTRSNSNVIRGMHFQIDYAAHSKLVSCPKGRVLDVVVDVRPESMFFNKPFTIELNEDSSKMLFIGIGYAHGFLSLHHDSWMLYYTSTVHNPSLDRGVLWSSIDLEWPVDSPILSDRDRSHPSIQSFA